MKKTTEELMEEFLAKGGKIQKLPTVPYEADHKVSSTVKKVPELKTLPQGEFLYGEVRKSKRKKVKNPDYTDIDMSLIPDHIKKLINYSDDTSEQNKEETNEADKNS